MTRSPLSHLPSGASHPLLHSGHAMTKPKAFVTRAIPREALDLVAAHAEMEVWPHDEPPDPSTLRRKAAHVDGILTNIMDRIDAPLFDAAVNLKVVSQMAVGLDNVDVAEATRRRIPVGYTPGVVSNATADQAFALLLAAARRLTEAERWVREGGWKIAFHPLFWLGAEVHNATIGIVGMGSIGLEMAKRARGFDMRILYHSRTRKPEAEALYEMQYVDMPTLLAESDYVSLHVPLTPETHHFIGADELSQMKPTAILVNAARGPVVDSTALYDALSSKTIAAAALDVTEPEPIDPNDPLLTLENLVVAPHLGSSTITTRTRMAVLAAQNLIAGLEGRPLPRCANPQIYP